MSSYHPTPVSGPSPLSVGVPAAWTPVNRPDVADRYGALWLKFNDVVTPVATAGERYATLGPAVARPGMAGFELVAADNALKVARSGVFHAQVTGSVLSSNNVVVGVYLGVAADGDDLDPGVAGSTTSDRIGESEVYVTMAGTARPTPFAIQGLVDLDHGDRVYVMVQNRNGTADITMEFMHLVLTQVAV